MTAQDNGSKSSSNKEATKNNTTFSKEQTKKTEAPSSDNNQKQEGATGSGIDIEKVVGVLDKNNPDKVPHLDRTYSELQDVRKKIKETEDKIKLIGKILTPHAKSKGHISTKDKKKIPVVDRSYLKAQKKDLKSKLRSLRREEKQLNSQIKEISNTESKAISLYDLSQMVKDPLYYKKYGKDIPPAISKFFVTPMEDKALEQLKELMKYTKTDTAEAVADFNDRFGRFLLWANPFLYTRCTGNHEARIKYFQEFREKLKSWNPAKAKLKDSKTETTKKTANNPAKKTQPKKKNGKKQPVKKTRKKQAAK